MTRRCHAGGSDTLAAFEELTSMLLHRTVLHSETVVRLAYLRGAKRDRAALGGAQGPTDPLRLTDGRYLRLSVQLFLDAADRRAPHGPMLKVADSSYQYQLESDPNPDVDRWVFRYDYLREPGPDPHPTAHLQVNGHLREPDVLDPRTPLARVHFPTGRISIEAVARLLIEQFHVPPRTPTDHWRPLLTASEDAFLDVAHRPRSGPDR